MEPSAYESEATSIAATESRTAQFMGDGIPADENRDPDYPEHYPTSFLAVRASPIHTAATIAVNITVVEFRMAAREAVRFISAALMRQKGIADVHGSEKHELPPAPPQLRQTPQERARRAASATAARPTRSSTRTKGPRAGTATRI